jgi:hypothetical protein
MDKLLLLRSVNELIYKFNFFRIFVFLVGVESTEIKAKARDCTKNYEIKRIKDTVSFCFFLVSHNLHGFKNLKGLFCAFKGN